MENHNGEAETQTWLPLAAEELFAAQVRTEREKRGLTQAKLARQLALRGVSISQSGIAKLERADNETRRPIRLYEAAALADLFGKSLDEMFAVVPTSPEHARWLEAFEQQSRALGDLIAARRALAEAEEAARLAEAEEAEARRALETTQSED